MTESRRRTSRALTSDQAETRFDTDGLDFEQALALVLQGGDDRDDTDAKREASE